MALALMTLLVTGCVPASPMLRLGLFPTFATPDVAEEPARDDLERLWLSIPEGRVEAWLLLGSDVDAAHPGPLVIAFHGNAEVIDGAAGRFARYRDLGVSVLLPEYRGYGRSDGSPSERAIVQDALRFHDFAVSLPEVDASRVFLHGYSLGGAVACAVAAERPPAALVLQSTFRSFASMVRPYGVPAMVLDDRFDSVGALALLESPTLVLHGTHDTMIPIEHGHALAHAAGTSVVELPCHHNDCHMDVVWPVVIPFLRARGVLHATAGVPAPSADVGHVLP